MPSWQWCSCQLQHMGQIVSLWTQKTTCCSVWGKASTGNKESIGFNCFNWATVIWMLIKVLPDDLGVSAEGPVLLCSCCFMLKLSVETRLIVGLAQRSSLLVIAFTSAVFHDNLDSFRPQISPSGIIRDQSIQQPICWVEVGGQPRGLLTRKIKQS